MADPYALEDGSHIAVIGGGPTGSFFSIFARKMAKMIGKEIRVTIFEPKDFTKNGPMGCNRCGGIISELLVQTLAVEGINLPESVIQRGIDSYKLHTLCGKVSISTPAREKTIAAVYRGSGPKGTTAREKESFDNFLLNLAKEEGAVHIASKVDRISREGRRPVLFFREKMICKPDLVVGAIGVKSQTSGIFEETAFGYRRPQTVTAAIAEISMSGRDISEYFGTSVNLFLLPVKGMKFAAMIPKGSYVTTCILGDNMNRDAVESFMDHPVVRSVLPEKGKYTIDCLCLPKMNVRAPKVPFTDRIVMCGDAGSTRLFKDGLGAAYLMGKAAANAAVLHGVGRGHFRRHYLPVYRSIMVDNLFGRFLFGVTGLCKKHRALTKAMLRVVGKEQHSVDYPKRLSSVLWDMFTGNERYKDIFWRSADMPMLVDLCSAMAVGGRREYEG